MKLHENEEDFKNAILATSSALKIRDIFVEKDYWVTYILKELSKSSHMSEVVFKGGTSLSKAYDLVHRFSEDVDLVILGKEGQVRISRISIQRKGQLKSSQLVFS